MDAPLIAELPVAMECKLVKVNEDGVVIGQIVNVSADESVLGEDGNIDLGKFRPIPLNRFTALTHVLGEKVGNAFSDGSALK